MTKQEIIIRDVREEDIEAILHIDKGIVGEQRATTYSHPKSTYLGGELGLSKVAEANGKVVGFAIGRIMAHPYRLEDIGFLSLIGVHPDAQQQGIATQLVTAFIAACRERKVKIINTLINLQDRAMLSFFKARGFQQNQVAEFTIDIRE
jgi:N-acetylglutamate synthase-like GNAT family acetyltransferase